MNVHVFLHSGFADWEIGFVLPELIEQKHQVTTFGLTPAPIRSLGGLTVVPDKALDELDPRKVDALIVPGGDFWPTFDNPALVDFVCELVAGRKVVAAICAATTFLARIGLLDRVEHTSNDKAFLKHLAPKYKGEALYRDRLAVTGGDVITASGLGAVEFTYEVLKKLQVPQSECDRWFKAFKHGDFASS